VALVLGLREPAGRKAVILFDVKEDQVDDAQPNSGCNQDAKEEGAAKRPHSSHCACKTKIENHETMLILKLVIQSGYKQVVVSCASIRPVAA
jgi:hypothetical protein